MAEISTWDSLSSDRQKEIRDTFDPDLADALDLYNLGEPAETLAEEGRRLGRVSTNGEPYTSNDVLVFLGDLNVRYPGIVVFQEGDTPTPEEAKPGKISLDDAILQEWLDGGTFESIPKTLAGKYPGVSSDIVIGCMREKVRLGAISRDQLDRRTAARSFLQTNPKASLDTFKEKFDDQPPQLYNNVRQQQTVSTRR